MQRQGKEMKWRTKENGNGGEHIGSIFKVHLQKHAGEKGKAVFAYLFDNDKHCAAYCEPWYDRCCC